MHALNFWMLDTWFQIKYNKFWTFSIASYLIKKFLYTFIFILKFIEFLIEKFLTLLFLSLSFYMCFNFEIA